jgi:hypothetical protein
MARKNRVHEGRPLRLSSGDLAEGWDVHSFHSLGRLIAFIFLPS